MTVELKRLDEVWTKDGERLGQARLLYHRTAAAEPADPDLKLYPAYLYVVSLEVGDDYYVPTLFIAGRDPGTNRVMLTATMADVMEETWSRMPDFVAHGQAREEALPET
ncbi:MAG TPA: hypothetical protein VF177_17555 [Anaerolineae bacterium]